MLPLLRLAQPKELLSIIGLKQPQKEPIPGAARLEFSLGVNSTPVAANLALATAACLE
jgi:hypothetical protein